MTTSFHATLASIAAYRATMLVECLIGCVADRDARLTLARNMRHGHSESSMNVADALVQSCLPGVEIWRGLGEQQQQLGDLRESEASYRQAMQIALDRFGLGHPLTIDVQRALGSLLIDVGKLSEADRLLGLAHERLSARFGGEHDLIAESWHQLGRLRWEQGRMDDANLALQRGLALRRRDGGLRRQPEMLCNMARVQSRLGHHAVAEGLARECLNLAKANQPGLVGLAERLLAWLALDRADLEQARQWLAVAEGEDDPDTLYAQVELARLRVKVAVAEGQLAAAEAELSRLRALPWPADMDAALRTWRVDAIQAGLHCLAGRLGTGRELIAATLAAVDQQAPERQRLLDDLASEAGACGVSR